jgi:hypothetical protein
LRKVGIQGHAEALVPGLSSTTRAASVLIMIKANGGAPLRKLPVFQLASGVQCAP